jgi:large subunit ribosomal protein L10
MKSEPAAWKPKEVAKLKKIIDSYGTIAIVNMEHLPSKQLQNMRSILKEKVLIKMSRKSLLERALKSAKDKEVQKLTKYLKGMPALLLSETDSFELYQILKKNQTSAPIKAGQKAPNDIIIPEGPTPFTPGPIIGQLGTLGIKSGVEAGKIVIKDASKAASEGDEVNQDLAEILTRLNIHPMKIGINVVAAYDHGVIYEKKVLDFDIDQFMSQLLEAHENALKLALELGILNSETVKLLISKAHQDAKTLALEKDIITSETTKQILAKAESTATKLKSMIQEEQ